MQLPLVEDSARFSCGSCTSCCNQPWRTMIEADKATALDRHDWSKYPQLAGRKFYQAAADGRAGFFDLAKGEGTKCLFLDSDGLCIIHKELGAAAKPSMCRQFPFLPSRTWTDDRISLNYGCPSVQKCKGELLSSQAEEIAEVTSVSTRAHKGAGVRVQFDSATTVSHAEYESILDRALEIFGEDRDGNIWKRFDTLLKIIAGQRPIENREGAGALRPARTPAATASGTLDASVVQNAACPLAVRMLFAATLFPDTLPAEKTGRIGFFKRLALLPKLMSLAQMRGAYASRVLGRNISIDRVLKHEVSDGLDPAATRLLARYFRSRFWQRMLIGTRLPIVAGVHQHILDFNAIIFLARAEAEHLGERVLGEPIIRKALTCVEFHLANQSRLYEQTLKGWIRTQLCDIGLARQSLALMAINRSEVEPLVENQCPASHVGNS